jgi:hypothetical protein
VSPLGSKTFSFLDDEKKKSNEIVFSLTNGNYPTTKHSSFLEDRTLSNRTTIISNWTGEPAN